MRRMWLKPACTTLVSDDLLAHIKAAARSDEGICIYFVLR